MLKHKYTVGDRVVVALDNSNAHLRPGVYTIVRVLPVAGFGCQYRAKHSVDTYERVLDEDALRPSRD